MRKLRRADELTAEGKTGEEIAAELEVSPATLYNWRRSYGGMDTDAARELKELREQNARLKRLLAEAELVKDALREVANARSLDDAQRSGGAELHGFPCVVLLGRGHVIDQQHHDAVVVLVEDRLAVHHTDPGADADVAVGLYPHQATCSDCSP